MLYISRHGTTFLIIHNFNVLLPWTFHESKYILDKRHLLRYVRGRNILRSWNHMVWKIYMCARNCVYIGLWPSIPPRTKSYDLVATLPPSVAAYVIKVWPLCIHPQRYLKFSATSMIFPLLILICVLFSRFSSIAFISLSFKNSRISEFQHLSYSKFVPVRFLLILMIYNHQSQYLYDDDWIMSSAPSSLKLKSQSLLSLSYPLSHCIIEYDCGRM